ncbi:putative RecQ-mediated genome instability protein 1 [Hypsibius exemplaris]|uniref:RecQ-mediated genome instability protein 1 n=1 Tax=Hypsibius exemplaris TaxID=2072580 RepID=A0A1W0WLF6_HYPEX|nr:putative RecQ-mediated genome instability protein 1 [Hypsibius exemplaris]
MQQIKNEFRKRNVQVPEEVLAVLHQEITGSRGVGTLEQRAVELWKNADLRSFYQAHAASTPLTKILQNKSTTKIGESLCLQIDSLRDVSRPAYQQLQKVINRFGENVLVTGDAETAPNKSEPTGKRMLLLNLTDGSKDIQAMEYQVIKTLSIDTPPGTKVRLIPPIMFRKGILLLTSENIHVIGGQVACLQEKFAQKRVLASLLNADLDAMEKAAPPCPPPNQATNSVVGLRQVVVQNAGNQQNGFDDPDGDAFLANVAVNWGEDDPDADAFLAGALDDFDRLSQN